MFSDFYQNDRNREFVLINEDDESIYSPSGDSVLLIESNKPGQNEFLVETLTKHNPLYIDHCNNDIMCVISESDVDCCVDELEKFDCSLIEVSQQEQQYVLQEVQRQYKRAPKNSHKPIKIGYRCASGPHQGKIVMDLATCNKRKNLKKVIQGKKSARLHKGVRVAKTRVTKRGPLSRMITRMNKLLSGNKNKTSS